MIQFKIRPDGLNELKKQLLVKAIPMGLLAIGGALAISYFTSNNAFSDISTLVIVILSLLGMWGFGAYIGVNRQIKLLENYTLFITDKGVPTSWLRVVTTESGEVITSYPILKP